VSAETRPVVLDASVVVALYVEETVSPAAGVTVGRFLSEGRALHAPALLLYEVANAFAKAVRRGVLDAEGCLEHLGSLASSEIEFHAATDLSRAATSLALAHGITAYDAAYLALALRLDAILATGDRRLATRSAATGVAVEPLSAS
jgi:predicted nucleic acid-binding protein